MEYNIRELSVNSGVAAAMTWKTMDVHEQRVRFVVAAANRDPSALCALRTRSHVRRDICG